MREYGAGVLVEIAFGVTGDGSRVPIMFMHGKCTQAELDETVEWCHAAHDQRTALMPFLPNQPGLVLNVRDVSITSEPAQTPLSRAIHEHALSFGRLIRARARNASS